MVFACDSHTRSTPRTQSLLLVRNFFFFETVLAFVLLPVFSNRPNHKDITTRIEIFLGASPAIEYQRISTLLASKRRVELPNHCKSEGTLRAATRALAAGAHGPSFVAPAARAIHERTHG